MDEPTGRVTMEGLDNRLRGVETALAGLTAEVRTWREQDRADESKRKETCPHASEFQAIADALKNGGKRFGKIEEDHDELATDVGTLRDDHDTLARRVDGLESWLRGAKWAVIAMAAVGGWLVHDAVPVLRKMLGLD